MIDQYLASLTKKIEAYNEVNELFEFQRRMLTMDNNEIKERTKKLIDFHENDVDDSLIDEVIEFKKVF